MPRPTTHDPRPTSGLTTAQIIGHAIDPGARYILACIFFVAALAKGQDFASVSAVVERVLGVEQAFARMFMGSLVALELGLASAFAGGILRRPSATAASLLGVAFVSWNVYLRFHGVEDCGCGIY